MRLGGDFASNRAASISATSAFSGRPKSFAAISSACQKIGSRLTDVWWPAISTERLTGGA